MSNIERISLTKHPESTALSFHSPPEREGKQNAVASGNSVLTALRRRLADAKRGKAHWYAI